MSAEAIDMERRLFHDTNARVQELNSTLSLHGLASALIRTEGFVATLHAESKVTEPGRPAAEVLARYILD